MDLVHQSDDIIAHHYRILDTLGQGGSGTTYLGQNLESGTKVALKVLSLQQLTDWKTLELFKRESKILHHPGIPRYLAYFHIDTPSDHDFYIAQELAPGKSLAAWVQSGWCASEDEVRRIAIQLCHLYQRKSTKVKLCPSIA
jgi:serine/threonine protein kinase